MTLGSDNNEGVWRLLYSTRSPLIDRTSWDSGIWDNEQDAGAWEFCDGIAVIERNPSDGHLRWRVGIMDSHAWYGRLLPDYVARGVVDRTVDTLGLFVPMGKSAAFDRLWWFGMDFNKHGDRVPASAPSAGARCTYPSFVYVEWCLRDFVDFLSTGRVR